MSRGSRTANIGAAEVMCYTTYNSILRASAEWLSHQLAWQVKVKQSHSARSVAYELANFNRQAGAFLNTLGRSKVEVTAQFGPLCSVKMPNSKY